MVPCLYVAGEAFPVHFHGVKAYMDQHLCAEIRNHADCVERIEYHSDLSVGRRIDLSL